MAGGNTPATAAQQLQDGHAGSCRAAARCAGGSAAGPGRSPAHTLQNPGAAPSRRATPLRSPNSAMSSRSSAASLPNSALLNACRRHTMIAQCSIAIYTSVAQVCTPCTLLTFPRCQAPRTGRTRAARPSVCSPITSHLDCLGHSSGFPTHASVTACANKGVSSHPKFCAMASCSRGYTQASLRSLLPDSLRLACDLPQQAGFQPVQLRSALQQRCAHRAPTRLRHHLHPDNSVMQLDFRHQNKGTYTGKTLCVVLS